MPQYLILVLISFLVYLPGSNASARQDELPQAVIRSPLAGQALQGIVTISGVTEVQGFQSAELSFAYGENPTQTWFLIAQGDEPVADGPLAQWDTTTITDGIYDLRLVVTLNDGSQQSAVVSSLRVRNYSPVGTTTPTPVTPTVTLLPGETNLPTSTPTPALTPTPASAITPSPLPPNPDEISSQDVAASLGRGVLAVMGLFALLGIYRVMKGIRD